MSWKTMWNTAFVVFAACVLSGCAPDANTVVSQEGPGFFMGWWHGFIAPITFVISLFSDSVGIYAIHNSGGWYNFGFLLGAGAFSVGCTRKHNR